MTPEMPSWKLCLQIIVIMSIVGFGLSILSGFLRVIALLAGAAVLMMLWRGKPRPR